MEQIRIGVYKTKTSSDITIFPLFKKEIGAFTSINKPIILKYPYEVEELGHALLKCLDTVNRNDFSAEDIGTPVIDTKRRKDMTKLYLFQSISCEIHDGYTFYPTIGEKDGSFSFLGLESGVIVNSSATKVELGEAILNTFDLCR